MTNPLGPGFRPLGGHPAGRPAPGSQEATDYDTGLHFDSPPPSPPPTVAPDLGDAVARLAWALFAERYDMLCTVTAEAARAEWTGDYRDTPGKRARWHGRARLLLAEAFPSADVAVVTTDAEYRLTSTSFVVVDGRRARIAETSPRGGVMFWHRVADALALLGYALRPGFDKNVVSREGYLEVPVRVTDAAVGRAGVVGG